MKRTTRRASWLIALLGTVLWTPGAQGYPYYDDPGFLGGDPNNGCVECHSGFSGGPPSAALHNRHVFDFGINNCNLCHPSGAGSTPVETYWSGTGGDLGCAGCHGRDYGETSPNSGQPKATGYGLRQHHANNGVPVCQTCHTAGALGHPNPLPAILPENVAPPYYGLSTNDLQDPCSSSEEDSLFDGDAVGLDNDGDGSVDFPADSDCSMATTTTTSSTTTTTLPPPVPAMSSGGGMLLGGLLTLLMGWALALRGGSMAGRSPRQPRRW